MFSACSGEISLDDLIIESVPAAHAIENELGEPMMLLPLPPSREIEGEFTTEFGETTILPPRPSREIATDFDLLEEEERLNALFASLNESIMVEKIVLRQSRRTPGGVREIVFFESMTSEAIEAWINVFQAMELSVEQFEEIDGIPGLGVYIVENGQKLPLGTIAWSHFNYGMRTMTVILNFEDLLDDIRHATALVSPDISIGWLAN